MTIHWLSVMATATDIAQGIGIWIAVACALGPLIGRFIKAGQA